MSFLGKGVVPRPGAQQEIFVPEITPAGASHHPRRLRDGKRLGLPRSADADSVADETCLLCGREILSTDEVDEEHPLPQWLQKLTDTKGSPTWELVLPDVASPLRKDFAFDAHKSCNSAFGRSIEEPASEVMRAILSGSTARARDIDVLLDWLDKIRSNGSSRYAAKRGPPS